MADGSLAMDSTGQPLVSPDHRVNGPGVYAPRVQYALSASLEFHPLPVKPRRSGEPLH